jgi:hypothetical protein
MQFGDSRDLLQALARSRMLLKLRNFREARGAASALNCLLAYLFYSR